MDYQYYFSLATTSAFTITGTLGNAVSTWIYLSKDFRQYSTNTYIGVSSIYNTLIVYLSWFYVYPEYRAFSTVMCKLSTLAIYHSVQFASWTLVIAILDRLLAVMVPFGFKWKNTIKGQMIILFIVFIALFALNIPAVIYSDVAVVRNTTRCAKQNNPNGNLVELIYLVSSTLVPFLIMLVSNIALIGCRFKSLKLRSTNRSFTREYRLAKILIWNDVYFFVLNFPQSFIVLLTYSGSSIKIPYIFYTAFGFLTRAYYTFPFFIHIICNRNFRKSFVSIFKKTKSVNSSKYKSNTY